MTSGGRQGELSYICSHLKNGREFGILTLVDLVWLPHAILTFYLSFISFFLCLAFVGSLFLLVFRVFPCVKAWYNSLSCAVLSGGLTACLLNCCIVMYHRCLVRCLYKGWGRLAGVSNEWHLLCVCDCALNVLVTSFRSRVTCFCSTGWKLSWVTWGLWQEGKCMC